MELRTKNQRLTDRETVDDVTDVLKIGTDAENINLDSRLSLKTIRDVPDGYVLVLQKGINHVYTLSTSTIRYINKSNHLDGGLLFIRFEGTGTIVHNYESAVGESCPILLSGEANITVNGKVAMIFIYDSTLDAFVEYSRAVLVDNSL